VDRVGFELASGMADERDGWRRLSAAFLTVAGGVLSFVGLMLAGTFGRLVLDATGERCGAFGCGVSVLFAALGVLLLLVGLLHLAAATGIRRQRRWGTWLAAGAVGSVFLLAIAGAGSELAGRQLPLSALIAVPWGLMTYSLWQLRRHADRPRRS
jgi:hypothetical protein